MFVSGNSEFANIDFHSEADDFTYFGDLNTSSMGSSSVAVAGYGRLSDSTLVIYKEDNAQEANIFYRNGTLQETYDSNGNLESIRAVFPTTVDMKFSKRLGTRHRAALGISEESDCIAIVVSEETGRVSLAVKGELFYNLALDDVRMMLIDELRPKQDIEYNEEEIDEDEIYEEDR